ncbi:hypothetical protein WJX74_008961 [Apatococcus lobatus]|uniref:Uncharacterized protein n=1 Tax=Apatococcus lobatus TaxID=904363 RepID=A0AAW1QXA1_9CHLO
MLHGKGPHNDHFVAGDNSDAGLWRPLEGIILHEHQAMSKGATRSFDWQPPTDGPRPHLPCRQTGVVRLLMPNLSDPPPSKP